MLQDYLIGSLIAFLTYIYFFYLFLNDNNIKDRNYPSTPFDKIPDYHGYLKTVKNEDFKLTFSGIIYQ